MKLTIYVPTYKRASLYQCLESVVPQIGFDVELIVSDNDPEGSAEPIAKQFSHVQYVKQAMNLGADGNCIRGLTSGKGEYVWVFGDDDIMLPYAVERTLSIVRIGDIDRIIHVGVRHGEVPFGYYGSFDELFVHMKDKSFLAASTLCSMNVWRRDAMDLRMGLTKLDTRNALSWAGLGCQSVKVLEVPTIIPGFTADFEQVEDWDKKMGAYIEELRLRFWYTGNMGDVGQWNYANA